MQIFDKICLVEDLCRMEWLGDLPPALPHYFYLITGILNKNLASETVLIKLRKMRNVHVTVRIP